VNVLEPKFTEISLAVPARFDPLTVVPVEE
jgi:hypothetical protein